MKDESNDKKWTILSIKQRRPIYFESPGSWIVDILNRLTLRPFVVDSLFIPNYAIAFVLTLET